MNDLLANLPKLHTTELGAERIRKNLALAGEDVVQWCRMQIASPAASMVRRGKNWYVQVNGCCLTIHASSYTIITAHREK